MAVKPIITYPNKILRLPTKTVMYGFRIQEMVDDCFDTLYETDRGAALAANQIGLDLRFFVINKNQEVPQGMPLVICNPEIISRSEETEIGSEGCLSFPGISRDVERAKTIEVTYMTVDGYFDQVELHGWMARVFQHEIDHLDGKLFVDTLPTKAREKIAMEVIANVKKRRKK